MVEILIIEGSRVAFYIQIFAWSVLRRPKKLGNSQIRTRIEHGAPEYENESDNLTL